MTTFIDFRFSRTLAAALFSGEEQEETSFVFNAEQDYYLVFAFETADRPAVLARLVDECGTAWVTLELAANNKILLSGYGNRALTETACLNLKSKFVGLRIGPGICGVKVDRVCSEAAANIYQGISDGAKSELQLECADGVRVMGQGSGRARRWGQLFYERNEPAGPCVELTMDWHHLRAGIPLFSTMTAEELVAQGRFRLRFRSYAYVATEAETTDFVRLFASDDPADIAVHMTPSLYLPVTSGVPNMAFAVTETELVHPHLVERCNKMDRLSVPSSFVRDAFIASGVECPVEVVLHGVDTDFYRPPETRQGMPGGRGFNFLAVGTHVERKNIKYLVQAFLEEFADHEDVALFLLLRPEYHTSQNNIVLDFTQWEREWAHDSAPILLWTGYLTREHLRDFYANADAYLMPSNEGFGLTLLEAMACGTPAIGLDHGGVLDFLNIENGILVPTARKFDAADIDTIPYVGEPFYEPDMKELRRAMRRMVSDRKLVDSLGARARADAEAITWAAVSRQFADAIEQTLVEYQASPSGNHAPPTREGSLPLLSVVLCVLDDTDAKASLNYLRGLKVKGINVLCLFTRYARTRDVKMSRSFGFVNYRWDGTRKNGLTIARAIFGTSWAVMLNVGEKIVGDPGAVPEYLDSLPQGVTEVWINSPSSEKEPRLYLVCSQNQKRAQVMYDDLSIESS